MTVDSPLGNQLFKSSCRRQIMKVPVHKTIYTIYANGYTWYFRMFFPPKSYRWSKRNSLELVSPRLPVVGAVDDIDIVDGHSKLLIPQLWIDSLSCVNLPRELPTWTSFCWGDILKVGILFMVQTWSRDAQRPPRIKCDECFLHFGIKILTISNDLTYPFDIFRSSNL